MDSSLQVTIISGNSLVASSRDNGRKAIGVVGVVVEAGVRVQQEWRIGIVRSGQCNRCNGSSYKERLHCVSGKHQLTTGFGLSQVQNL